jgi:hypothetical protein
MESGMSEFLASNGWRTEDEAAERLNKSKRALQLWRQRRVGPAWTRNGKEILYRDDWLLDYLVSSKQEPVRSRENESAAVGNNQDALRPPLKRKSKRRERRSPDAS